jgi:hypothetical protein
MRVTGTIYKPEIRSILAEAICSQLPLPVTPDQIGFYANENAAYLMFDPPLRLDESTIEKLIEASFAERGFKVHVVRFNTYAATPDPGAQANVTLELPHSLK